MKAVSLFDSNISWIASQTNHDFSMTVWVSHFHIFKTLTFKKMSNKNLECRKIQVRKKRRGRGGNNDPSPLQAPTPSGQIGCTNRASTWEEANFMGGQNGGTTDDQPD